MGSLVPKGLMITHEEAKHKAADTDSKGNFKIANGVIQGEFRDKRDLTDASKTFAICCDWTAKGGPSLLAGHRQ